MHIIHAHNIFNPAIQDIPGFHGQYILIPSLKILRIGSCGQNTDVALSELYNMEWYRYKMHPAYWLKSQNIAA